MWPGSQMVITQFYVRRGSSEPADSLSCCAFYEDIGSAVVPYDLSERQKLCGYNTLRCQVEFHKDRLKSAKSKK